MIGSSYPYCIASGVTISDCIFTGDRQLLIVYAIDGGEDTSDTLSFTISSFKNPVKPGDLYGFSIFSTDENNYNIGLSEVLYLSTVTDANTFDDVQFSFEDSSNAGEYVELRINVNLQ